MKKKSKRIVYIALFIDDNLMICIMEFIDNTIMALKENGLVLKIMERLQDYLSCEIKFALYKKRAWLGQPHFVKNLKTKFSQHI